MSSLSRSNLCRNSHALEKILKFGGTSVGSPERIKSTLAIIRQAYEQNPKIAVVVSAFTGITDALIVMGSMASEGKSYRDALAAFNERHVHAVQMLIAQEQLEETLATLVQHMQSLESVLEGVFLIRELSAKTQDLLLSFGERLSAYIIAQALRNEIPEARFQDAREIIKTDRHFGAANVDFVASYQHIRKNFLAYGGMPIITGFIASSSDNETVTLGRGGSDYTAAIIGAALQAKSIEIWTDVDGVMTADPRKEEHAYPLPAISYQEAMEMSHFGAKVIHPPTILPAMEENIPLLIKNSFRPEAPGTWISHALSEHAADICGISSISDAVLLSLQGSGMVGVCGVAERLFGALAEKGINIIMISQGSSEHSICFAVLPSAAEMAQEAIRKEFALEMKVHMIDEIAVTRNLAVIAAVGENMRQTPGISGKLFAALGKNNINVVAIAQGSSERNISVVIKKSDEVKAINAIHETFFLSPCVVLNLFLVGIGLIGKTLLRQLADFVAQKQSEMGLDIRVVGLANSRSMVFDAKGLSLDKWEELLQVRGQPMEIEAFAEKMQKLNLVNAVFVDCTASQDVSDLYQSILRAHIAIVTPNKKANSGSFIEYNILKSLASQTGTSFLYGTNVGAGLPIIRTIQEQIACGDKIIKIEAILSGTMSYLFNAFTIGKDFSSVVHEAQAKGYTEPDPREDLNGLDVARKLLILARESGYSLEMDDIDIAEFLPEDCFAAASIEEFYHKLQECDHLLADLLQQAQLESKVLRYIATFDAERASVSLQAVGREHPFYHMASSDNIVAITTEIYRERPLVIQGQGAGANLTAANVLKDIVRLGLKT